MKRRQSDVLDMLRVCKQVGPDPLKGKGNDVQADNTHNTKLRKIALCYGYTLTARKNLKPKVLHHEKNIKTSLHFTIILHRVLVLQGYIISPTRWWRTDFTFFYYMLLVGWQDRNYHNINQLFLPPLLLLNRAC